MILCYLLISLILSKLLLNSLEKIAAGAVAAVVVQVVVVVNTSDKYSQHFLRTESVKYPACVVFTKSRARHVHVMSIYLQVVKVH